MPDTFFVVIAMHRFYVDNDKISNGKITITGQDVNHIKNVLRMKPGDGLIICNGQGKDCYCIINRVSDTEVETVVKSVKDTDTELPVRITLFQGIPKSDKMELIIQKAVELGVYEIVPVMTARCVVKYTDSKKEDKKSYGGRLYLKMPQNSHKGELYPKYCPLCLSGRRLNMLLRWI